MKRQFFSAILSALVLAAASVGVTAFAEETATEQTTSKSTVEERQSKAHWFLKVRQMILLRRLIPMKL